MNKRFIVALLVVVATVVIASVLFSTRQEKPTTKVRVAASLYPFAEIARQVGKDKIELTTIAPPGVEPHDFEPSPQDLVKLQKAKVFIYSGAGFEPWADKVIADIKNVKVVSASSGIRLLPAIENEEAKANKSGTDPHFYLDPVLLQQSVDNVAEALSNVDPANTSYYTSNAKSYKQKLEDLDKDYREGLSKCQRRDIITGHAAFAYLTKRYHLRQIPVAGLSEQEPSPARLAEIAKFAKENGLKYIFVEKLVSPRLSETIASEVGAKLLVLNPIEGLTEEDRKAGKDYLSLMRDNLTNLRIALGCAQP